MLADNKKRSLDFQYIDGTLTINLSSCPIPEEGRNKYAEVIVV